MGIFGCMLQDYRIRWYVVEKLRPRTVYSLYALAGLATVCILGALSVRSKTSSQLLKLVRTNSLFAISLFSVIAWSTFTFAWEPATSHYWTLGLFPALVCVATLLPTAGNVQWIAAVLTALPCAWNCYFNHDYDAVNSAHFSEAMLQSTGQYVGSRDIFIVLSDDQWFANINYILLFRVLQYTAPKRGIAIFNDLVFAPGGSRSWRDHLANRIDATLRAGGHVYIAAHVFDPHSYEDLSQANNPFNEQINRSYLAIDGNAFHREIEDFFSCYYLKRSDFSIGRDDYLSVQGRPK
jgi:hypothetical protein